MHWKKTKILHKEEELTTRKVEETGYFKTGKRMMSRTASYTCSCSDEGSNTAVAMCMYLV
jgi:hypothetical protein